MSAPPVRLYVPGGPVPQGSLRPMAFLVECTSCRPGEPCGNKRACENGRRATANAIYDGDRELRAWRDKIAAAARAAFERPMSGPVEVVAAFLFHRPGNHRGVSGKMLAAGKARPRPTCRPDGDKLLRGVLDALTGVVYLDDAQVVDARAVKAYAFGRDEGVMIQIRQAERADETIASLLLAFGAVQGGDGDVWPIDLAPPAQLDLVGDAT